MPYHKESVNCNKEKIFIFFFYIFVTILKRYVGVLLVVNDFNDIPKKNIISTQLNHLRQQAVDNNWNCTTKAELSTVYTLHKHVSEKQYS